MKRLLKLMALALAVFMLVPGTMAVVSANDSAPQMSINYCNLSFRDNVCIKYAVASASPEETRLLLWDAPSEEYLYGTHAAELETVGNQTIDGVSHMVFDFTQLAAKQMTDVVYARAYTVVDGNAYYSNVTKYSILQYAYSKLGKTAEASADENLKALLGSMLEYGAKAQNYFDYNTNRLATDDFYQVKVEKGVIDDQCTHGLYLEGEVVNISAPAVNEEGTAFSHWENSAGEVVANTAEAAITVEAKNDVYTAVYTKTSVGLEFDTNGDGTCCLVGMGDCQDTDIIIPRTSPENDVVTAIDSSAFAGEMIRSITLPDTIEEIGRKAFNGCTSLTDVYYEGTKEQWEILCDSIGTGNTALLNANIHFGKATYYTVTFVDHDGSVLGTAEVASGEAATAPVDPVRDGYTFTGWDVPFDNVTADLKVTAQYKKNEVTYDGPTFVVESVTASAGEEIEVAVEIKNNPGLFGAVLTFTYDSKLVLKSASAGSAFDEFVMTPAGVLASPCNFVWDGQANPAVKDGEILKMVFSVSEEASAGDELKISCSYIEGDVVDASFAAVNLDLVDGVVVVK